MSDHVHDTTGDPATVQLTQTEGGGSYIVSVPGQAHVGRVDFIDPPEQPSERIFFHTEVDPAFGGRGLARILLREALDDSLRKEITVVPVCPLFARHLERHGAEYEAAGGRFRRVTRSDLELVQRATQAP